MDASNSLDAARIERKRKKKSRWAGTESEKTFIPGMPTVLPAGMTPDQQQAYLGESRLFLKSSRVRHSHLFSLQFNYKSKKLVESYGRAISGSHKTPKKGSLMILLA